MSNAIANLKKIQSLTIFLSIFPFSPILPQNDPRKGDEGAGFGYRLPPRASTRQPAELTDEVCYPPHKSTFIKG